MPVDTAAKRQSVLVANDDLDDYPPRPDGTIAVADRQTLLSVYGGIDTSIAVSEYVLDATALALHGIISFK